MSTGFPVPRSVNMSLLPQKSEARLSLSCQWQFLWSLQFPNLLFPYPCLLSNNCFWWVWCRPSCQKHTSIDPERMYTNKLQLLHCSGPLTLFFLFGKAPVQVEVPVAGKSYLQKKRTVSITSLKSLYLLIAFGLTAEEKVGHVPPLCPIQILEYDIKEHSTDEFT